MTAKEFLQHLLNYEHRVATLYLTLGNRPNFPGDLRSFWHRMAEDERHHTLVLQRSRMLLDLQETAPVGSQDVFYTIEQQLTAAETAIEQADISVDEALRHTVILESSELNRLSDTWFRCFPPTLQALLTALTPEDNVHLRRVVEVVQAFSSNKTLQEQAVSLWMKSQHAKTHANTSIKTKPSCS